MNPRINAKEVPKRVVRMGDMVVFHPHPDDWQPRINNNKVCAAIVTKVNEDGKTVNLKVVIDANGSDLWRTSVDNDFTREALEGHWDFYEHESHD